MCVCGAFRCLLGCASFGTYGGRWAVVCAVTCVCVKGVTLDKTYTSQLIAYSSMCTTLSYVCVGDNKVGILHRITHSMGAHNHTRSKRSPAQHTDHTHRMHGVVRYTVFSVKAYISHQCNHTAYRADNSTPQNSTCRRHHASQTHTTTHWNARNTVGAHLVWGQRSCVLSTPSPSSSLSSTESRHPSPSKSVCTLLSQPTCVRKYMHMYIHTYTVLSRLTLIHDTTST